MSLKADQLDDTYDYSDPEMVGYQDRLRHLRDTKGVARLRLEPRTGPMLLRYDDVREGFSNNKCFSKSLALRDITFAMMGPNIQGYDGDEHRIKRGLVSRTFRPRTVQTLIEPLLRPLAEELADELYSLGSADLMATFAKRYPLRVITTMLGIPREDEDQMAAWAFAMLRGMTNPKGARRANEEFARYVSPLVQLRRAEPASDLLSIIVTEEVEGQRLDNDEVCGFLRLLFPAGVDTVWLTMGSMMIAVLEHPEVQQRLIDSQEDRNRAIEETLRWESATGTEGRVTTADVVCSGVEIPAGQRLDVSRGRQPRSARIRRPRQVEYRPPLEAARRFWSGQPFLPWRLPGKSRTQHRTGGAAAAAAKPAHDRATSRSRHHTAGTADTSRCMGPRVEPCWRRWRHVSPPKATSSSLSALPNSGRSFMTGA